MRRALRLYWLFFYWRLDQLLTLVHLPWYLKLLIRVNPFFWRRPKGTVEQRLRQVLVSLGPVWVKFGQLLSTRRDLLPLALANELAKLQDAVEPFDSKLAQNIIEGALGQSVDGLFAEFELEPLASASVAQVHAAKLKDGRDVVVKVIRPGIRKQIDQDFGLVKKVATQLQKIPELQRLHPKQVVADYHQTFIDELDLLREAANASTLRRNFDQSSLLYVPEMHWDYCRSEVLVMERIYGLPISDIEGIDAAGIDRARLAAMGVEIFFTQVFRDSFFHADMHPGNVFVETHDPVNARYIGIDCGIVGTLNEDDKRYLALNLLAFFQRDYRQVAQLHIDSGWVPNTTRVNELEQAIRAVCEPIFAKPLSEISFATVLIRLFQTARRFDMEVQPQLILLQKTLLHVEGLGRQLYPQLDLWKTALPYLESWLKEQLSPKYLAKLLKQHAPSWLTRLHYWPEWLQNGIEAAPALVASQQAQQQNLDRIEKELRRARQRQTVILIAFGLGAALWWWQF